MTVYRKGLAVGPTRKPKGRPSYWDGGGADPRMPGKDTHGRPASSIWGIHLAGPATRLPARQWFMFVLQGPSLGPAPVRPAAEHPQPVFSGALLMTANLSPSPEAIELVQVYTEIYCRWRLSAMLIPFSRSYYDFVLDFSIASLSGLNRLTVAGGGREDNTPIRQRPFNLPPWQRRLLIK